MSSGTRRPSATAHLVEMDCGECPRLNRDTCSSLNKRAPDRPFCSSATGNIASVVLSPGHTLGVILLYGCEQNHGNPARFTVRDRQNPSENQLLTVSAAPLHEPDVLPLIARHGYPAAVLAAAGDAWSKSGRSGRSLAKFPFAFLVSRIILGHSKARCTELTDGAPPSAPA